MSAFGNYEQDEIVDAIRSMAHKRRELGQTTREVIEAILDAVKYGIDYALHEAEEK